MHTYYDNKPGVFSCLLAFTCKQPSGLSIFKTQERCRFLSLGSLPVTLVIPTEAVWFFRTVMPEEQTARSSPRAVGKHDNEIKHRKGTNILNCEPS